MRDAEITIRFRDNNGRTIGPVHTAYAAAETIVPIPLDATHAVVLRPAADPLPPAPLPHNGQRLDEYMLDRLARIEVEAAATYARHRAEIEARLHAVETSLGMRLGR